jgi:hypothetical protein
MKVSCILPSMLGIAGKATSDKGEMVRIPIVGLVLLTAMLGSRPARLAAQAPAVGSEPVAAVVEAVAPAVEAMVPASVPGDLSLGQAVREALAANPDLAVARARLAAAQAAVDGARAAFFPRVSAMVQYNEREYSPSSLGFAGMPAAAGGGTRTSIVQTDGLTFQWPIDLGQRTALALRRARAGERKAASDRRGAESEVIALTIEAFLGVRRAAELKRRHGWRFPEIKARLVARRGRQAEVDTFRRLWTGVADFIDITPYHTWLGAVQDERAYGGAPRYPCALLWYTGVINADGRVSPCCIDYDQKGDLGPIGEGGFAAIWNGPALRRLRRLHLEGAYDRTAICGPCEYWLIKENLGAWLRRKYRLPPLPAGGAASRPA